jgi:uncharacterized DUF497 family protein
VSWAASSESRSKEIDCEDVSPKSIVIGESTRGRLLFVVITTDAEGKMRIISARRATKRERHAYEEP